MPVVFILILPIALAASIKNGDRADNHFTFVYDSETESFEAYSSNFVDSTDDVEFMVYVAESNGTTPLVGRVMFRLLKKTEGVRYDGDVRFRVIDDDNKVAYTATEEVSFTLRPKDGMRKHRITFPFDVPTGLYSVTVRFSN